MKNKFRISWFLPALIIIIMIAGCDKSKEYPVDIPPSQANFLNKTTATYTIVNNDTSVYRLPVGVTTVSDKSRVINLAITSPTGAVPGVQYSTNSLVTIPAGKAIDTLFIHGLYAGYTATRIDTLVVTITGGDAAPSDYNNTFKLISKR